MQTINEISAYFNTFSRVLKELLNAVYVEHSNAYLHVLITILFTILILTNLHIKTIHKRLNEMDKRYTILLLSIQKYCSSINRSLNELSEKNDKNMQIIVDNDNKTLSHIRTAHQRVKDAYTGIFKYLDIKKIRQAPKEDTQQSTEENTERNDILREVINEMIVTDFTTN